MEIMNKNLETASHLRELGAFLSSKQIRTVNRLNHQIFKAYTPLTITYSIHKKTIYSISLLNDGYSH